MSLSTMLYSRLIVLLVVGNWLRAVDGAITSIYLIEGHFWSRPSCRDGYSVIEFNLIDGAWASRFRWTYFCFSKRPQEGDPMTSITFVLEPAVCPVGFVKDPISISSGKQNLMLCVSRQMDQQEKSRFGIRLLDVANSCDDITFGIKLPLGLSGNMICIDGHLRNPPYQPKLAFSGLHSMGLSIAWATDKALTEASSQTYEPVVRFGKLGSVDSITLRGSTSTYSFDYYHAVVLPESSLTPGALYWFCFGDETHGIDCGYNFTSPRAWGDSTPFRAFVLGDMGIDFSYDTLNRMIQHVDEADFYMHVGDMSYADDRAVVGPNVRYEEVWNKWQDSVAKVTARKPYMVVPGNHEKACVETDINCNSVHRNFLPYNTRFRMPWFESGGPSNLWYSFDVGLVHFTGINTEAVFGGGNLTAQIEWLENDLAIAVLRRHIQPWIIVIGHRPMYASSSSVTLSKLREAFESVFIKYKVDIFIAGHEHYFERMWPVNNQNVVQKNYDRPTAPVHIVNGAAGCIERLSSYGTITPDATAFRNNEAYGYGWLEIYNRTTLRTSFVDAASDKVIDEVFIVREDSQSFEIV